MFVTACSSAILIAFRYVGAAASLVVALAQAPPPNAQPLRTQIAAVVEVADDVKRYAARPMV